jgi:hypothetical protein
VKVLLTSTMCPADRDHDPFMGVVENAGGQACRSSAISRSRMSWAMAISAGLRPIAAGDPVSTGFRCRRRAAWAAAADAAAGDDIGQLAFGDIAQVLGMDGENR